MDRLKVMKIGENTRKKDKKVLKKIKKIQR